MQIFLCLLLLFITGYQTQDPSTTTEPFPDWYGDPRICTVNTPTTPAPGPTPPLPKFTEQAEFRLERVIIRHRTGGMNSSELTLYHYYYDYENNKLTLIENRNGTYDAHFYDYDTLKRATYYFQEQTCKVEDIPTANDMDGRSAILIDNTTWHIRPMNEFLLFSNDAPGRQVTPVYLGQEVVRGIPVDTWQTCHINRTQRRTVKRVWSFAQQGVSMPSGDVGEFAVPVQAIINASIVDTSDVQTLEFDEISNVLSYKLSLSRLAMSIPQPRGIYCDNILPQQLVSLSDAGIRWPYRFNVRIEASTSTPRLWERVHLYYHQGDDESSGRLRYDYLPPNAENYESVMHDYTDNLTYVVDRRLGTCQINRGVEIPDVDPIRDPVKFFIKNEARFIITPPEKVWENRGLRRCRANSIECVILTAKIFNFPPIIEPDTGKPSGQTWDETNMEYAWAMRAQNGLIPSNETKVYDYPVSLYLRMYRYNTDPLLPPVQTADVEYEFYEMSHDGNLNEFDVSTCYRSKRYEYLHLVFVLKLNRANITESRRLNRRQLDRDVHYQLINRMNIRYTRLTDLEIDHEEMSDDLTVFFTILGRTPNPGSSSGFVDDEATAEEARDIIKQVIDNGQFEFEIRLRDNSVVQFRGEPNSLISSKQYISTHAFGRKVSNQKYTASSQVLAAVVGALIGLFVGVALAAILRLVRKQPMPVRTQSISNPRINYTPKAEDTVEATTSDA